MVGKQKLQGFSAGLQYLWGVGPYFHAFVDRVYAGNHQASCAFYFYYTDTACADLVDLF